MALLLIKKLSVQIRRAFMSSTYYSDWLLPRDLLLYSQITGMGFDRDDLEAPAHVSHE